MKNKLYLLFLMFKIYVRFRCFCFKVLYIFHNFIFSTLNCDVHNYGSVSMMVSMMHLVLMHDDVMLLYYGHATHHHLHLCWMVNFGNY